MTATTRTKTMLKESIRKCKQQHLTLTYVNIGKVENISKQWAYFKYKEILPELRGDHYNPTDQALLDFARIHDTSLMSTKDILKKCDLDIGLIHLRSLLKKLDIPYCRYRR